MHPSCGSYQAFLGQGLPFLNVYQLDYVKRPAIERNIFLRSPQEYSVWNLSGSNFHFNSCPNGTFSGKPSLTASSEIILFTPSPSPYCALLFFIVLIESWHIICVIVHLLLVCYYCLLRLTHMPHEGRDLLWFTMTSPVFPSRLGTK